MESNNLDNNPNNPVIEPETEKENAIRGYRIQTKSRWLSFWKIHNCHRHEVATQTQHLILYRTDNSQIAMPVENLTWVVYPEYWQFMKQIKKKLPPPPIIDE
jgi:hypothetical protein